ncbi:MAG: hypothetical protein H6745_06860 [Deltaproteobacteria bacterium]|nr:hypothetical protein [Deltaproteobacteria bacterium]
MTLSLGAAACGGKASEDQCKAAYANMTKLTVSETLDKMKDMSDDMKAEAKKKAEEAMKGQEAGFLTGCKEAPGSAVSCMAEAKTMADYQACATKQ